MSKAKKNRKRWKAFSKRERAVLSFSISAGMVVAATVDESETPEDRKRSAQTMLDMTKLMSEISESMGMDPVKPQLVSLLEQAAEGEIELNRIEVAPVERI